MKNVDLEEMTGWRNELGFRLNALKAAFWKLRGALIDALEARRDDEGLWIDRNGDPVDALNEIESDDPPNTAVRHARENDGGQGSGVEAGSKLRAAPER